MEHALDFNISAFNWDADTSARQVIESKFRMHLDSLGRVVLQEVDDPDRLLVTVFRPNTQETANRLMFILCRLCDENHVTMELRVDGTIDWYKKWDFDPIGTSGAQTVIERLPQEIESNIAYNNFTAP